MKHFYCVSKTAVVIPETVVVIPKTAVVIPETAVVIPETASSFQDYGYFTYIGDL